MLYRILIFVSSVNTIVLSIKLGLKKKNKQLQAKQSFVFVTE